MSDFLKRACSVFGCGTAEIGHARAAAEHRRDLKRLRQFDFALLSEAPASDARPIGTVVEDARKVCSYISSTVDALTSEVQLEPGQREEALETIVDFISSGVLPNLVKHITALSYEAQMGVTNVFSVLLRPGMPEDMADLARDCARIHVLPTLIKGYRCKDIAPFYGIMIRSCIRHRGMTQVLLDSGLVFDLTSPTTWSESYDSFDAFVSLRALLLDDKKTAATWLQSHFKEFFTPFNGLLEGDEYVVLRQALKLLSDVLLCPVFSRVMIVYVGNYWNLRTIMKLLHYSSRTIQFEAFQVFKLFVANPRKPSPVAQILHKNKEQLVALLEVITPVVQDDTFDKDRGVIISKLKALDKPPPSKGSSKATTASPPESVKSLQSMHLGDVCFTPMSFSETNSEVSGGMTPSSMFPGIEGAQFSNLEGKQLKDGCEKPTESDENRNTPPL